MGAAVGALKEAGNENFVSTQKRAADRADTLPVAPDAVKASADVHEAVFAAVKGREGHRANQFPAFQFCGAHGADLRVARYALGPRFNASSPPGKSAKGGDAHAEKEGIAKPEKKDSYQ